MSSIQTPSYVLQGSDNPMSSMRGKVKGSTRTSSTTTTGVPATPRMALGEVSNFVRHASAIEATPKLRSNGLHKPKQVSVLSSSDSDEFDEIETIRETSRDDHFGGIMNLSPVSRSPASFGELSIVGSEEEDDDEGYPPIENMFIPPRGYDEFYQCMPDEEEKEIFANMSRVDDLVPVYVSAEVKLILNGKSSIVGEEELEFEPMPDETLMAFDLTGCDDF